MVHRRPRFMAQTENAITLCEINHTSQNFHYKLRERNVFIETPDYIIMRCYKECELIQGFVV